MFSQYSNLGPPYPLSSFGYAIHYATELTAVWIHTVRLLTHVLCKPTLLLEKPNYKNPRRFLYLVAHTKFVLIPKCSTVPCRIFRGISF